MQKNEHWFANIARSATRERDAMRQNCGVSCDHDDYEFNSTSRSIYAG